jgi:hypothetical protein
MVLSYQVLLSGQPLYREAKEATDGHLPLNAEFI